MRTSHKSERTGTVATDVPRNIESTEGVFPMAETQVSSRIDLESGGRIGPGKIALLEAIRKTGSITAGAVAMKMSYRRAWLLVDELNKLLSEPVVTTAAGGAMGGGTTVTPVGEKTTTQSKRTLEQPRAANFRPCGN
jgi:molybdate transport system regulatory protein